MKVRLGKEMRFRKEQDANYKCEVNVVEPGEYWARECCWCASPDKRHVLVFQEDGNLCLYELDPSSQPGPNKDVSGEPVWSTNTVKHSSTYEGEKLEIGE